MSRRPEDWDQEERDALAGLEDQLEAIRRRHAADPAIEMLRAARADALPEAVQADVRAHLDGSAWSRSLVEGLDEAGDQPALDRVSEERLWERIRRQAAAVPPRASGRRWAPWAVGGAALAASVTVAMLVSRREARAPAPTVAPSPSASPSRLAPPLEPVTLTFTKPDIRLSAAALTWRGVPTANPFLLNLKPAVDAYRDGDYAQADALFTALAARYPQSVEVAFFQGVTRMLRDDFAGAIDPLVAAAALGDPAFTEDVEWYLAVAEQRSGRVAEARRRLDRLCLANGLRAGEACVAGRQLADSVPGSRP